jgi:O-antigen/teichoic acid export membrane protein
MGIFTAANQWRIAVAFLPSLLSQPLLSMLSNLGGLGNFGSFKKLLRANILLSFGLSASIAVPIIFCSSWIMNAYGRDFLAGRSVLILLVFAAVLSSTAAVIGQAMMSLEKVWWTYIFNLIWALVLVGSALLLVPRYGALGLAEAFLAAYLVNALTVSTFAQVLFRKLFEAQP